MLKNIFFVLSFFLLCTPVFADTAVPFTITMNEVVNVTGTPRIAVDVGGVTRYATYASGTGTSSLTFTYDMVAGDVDLDGVTLSSPIDLNGGTITDLNGNPETDLTFTVPNTSGIKIDYPSLSMDFVADADGRYTLNGTAYNDLPSFLSATGGTFSRNSVGTYYDASGTLQTATANQPRFDHDPVTHAPKGILIEESRTNEILQSTFESGYIKINEPQVSYTPNYALAPDGTFSALRIKTSAVTDPGNSTYTIRLYRPISSTTGQVRTLSVFVKPITTQTTYANPPDQAQVTRDIRLQLSSDVSGGAVFCNLHTRQMEAATGNAIGEIEEIGNGWLRCSITYTATSNDSNDNQFISLNNRISSQPFDPYPDGTEEVLIWGAQNERSAFPTSYIPTTSAAVTRAADVLTMPTGDWYNIPEGTLFSESQNEYTRASQPHSGAGFEIYAGGQNNLVALNIRRDGTTSRNGRIVIFPQSGGFYHQGTSGPSNNITNPDVFYKLAGAMQSGNSAITYDGLAPRSFASTFDPPVPTAMGIGANRYYYNYMIGHIKKLKYYPARVPDAQLQLMTQ